MDESRTLEESKTLEVGNGEFEDKIFKISEIKDLEYVAGGAATVTNANNNLVQTSRTTRCNCGMFEPLNNGVNLDICDNCKWAEAVSEDSIVTHCQKQKKYI